MTTMRCPLGHPPGPQPFCPICGRATTPVADEGTAPGAVSESVEVSDAQEPVSYAPTFDLDVEYDGPGSTPFAPPPPPPPPAPPVPPVGGPSWSDFQDTPPAPSAPEPPAAPQTPAGSAAAETRRLIDELQAGRPVVPPTFPQVPAPTSWAGDQPAAPEPPQAPEPPHYGSGVFPTGDIPDYAPLAPEAADEPRQADPPPSPAAPPPPVPPTPSAPPVPPGPPAPSNPPPFELPPRASVLDTFHDGMSDERTSGRGGRSGSKLLPLLLVGAVLLGGAFLATKLLGGGGEETVTTAPPTRPSASARPSTPAPVQSYSAEQIAAAMKDPHFKHGYDAGVRRAKAGAITDPRGTCRAMGLAERKQGYGWGAHDQQGCIVGITA